MVTLKSGRIVDEWSTLIEQSQGEAEALLQAIDGRLRKHKAPGLTWRRENIAPGWLKGFFGKRRDFLLLSHKRFKDYLMAISARDYGSNLQVSWYLTGTKRSDLVRMLARIPWAGAPAGMYLLAKALDVFDQQDLSGWVTVGHSSVLRSVEEVMQQRNLDLTRLERRSRSGLASA
ncbi:MAG TPA: hypothetical protein VGV06_12345 [Methylomirabilota bacterium]|nr:hypothetical protein [Methylomirabilota bacterium]